MFSTPKTLRTQRKQQLAPTPLPLQPAIHTPNVAPVASFPPDRDLVSSIESFAFAFRSNPTFDREDKNLNVALESVARNILYSAPTSCPLPLHTHDSLNKRLTAFERLSKELPGLNTRESTRSDLLEIGEQLQLLGDLWNYHCRVSNDPENAFNRILQIYNNGQLDVKKFFTTPDIILLIKTIQIPFSSLPPGESLDMKSCEFAIDASELLCKCFEVVLSYRKENGRFFGLFGDDPYYRNEWTGTPEILDALQFRFEYNQSVLDGRKISSEQRASLCKLQSQLANYIFHNLKSQKMFSVDGSSKSQEIHSHAEKMVSKIFHSLYHIGQRDQCVHLAEVYREYKYLIEFSHYREDEEKGRLFSKYISRFGYEFAEVLYESYLSTSKYDKLMNADKETLEIFLASHPEISWIYDISTKQYGKASNTLLEISKNSSKFQYQKLLSSLSLLCAIENDPNCEIDDYSESLEFTIVQETLQTDIKESGLNNILTTHFKNVSDKKRVKDVLIKLIDGKSCKIEEVAYILTFFGTFQYLQNAYELVTKIGKIEDIHIFWKRVYSFTDWNRFIESDAWSLIKSIANEESLGGWENINNSIIMPQEIMNCDQDYENFTTIRIKVGMDEIILKHIASESSQSIVGH